MTNKAAPIFIVGFPRSGTTFLQSLLCTQPGLVSFPETHFFTNGVGHYPADKLIDLDEFRELIEVIETKNGLALDKDFIERSNREIESGGVNQKSVFDQLVSQLLRAKNDSTANEVRWIEKTPVNALYMDKILNYYPNAKFIAIIRNPVQAIDSYYHKLLQYREPVHDLAAYWKRINDAIEDFSSRNSNAIKIVKYEDIVVDQSGKIGEIMKFIDQPFSSDLLSNYQEEAKALVREDEHWKKSNVGDGNYIADSKPKLSVKHIFQIQFVLEEKMGHYGYRMQYPLVYRLYKAVKSVTG